MFRWEAPANERSKRTHGYLPSGLYTFCNVLYLFVSQSSSVSAIDSPSKAIGRYSSQLPVSAHFRIVLARDPCTLIC